MEGNDALFDPITPRGGHAKKANEMEQSYEQLLVDGVQTQRPDEQWNNDIPVATGDDDAEQELSVIGFDDVMPGPNDSDNGS